MRNWTISPPKYVRARLYLLLVRAISAQISVGRIVFLIEEIGFRLPELICALFVDGAPKD